MSRRGARITIRSHPPAPPVARPYPYMLHGHVSSYIYDRHPRCVQSRHEPYDFTHKRRIVLLEVREALAGIACVFSLYPVEASLNSSSQLSMFEQHGRCLTFVFGIAAQKVCAIRRARPLQVTTPVHPSTPPGCGAHNACA